MYRIYDDHSKKLPFVRIKRIELLNFKGVQHGEIEFNCAKEFVPYNTKSDILGLYGQNGSGKSSLVEALNTLKGIISGYKMGNDFAKYVDVESDYAKICIELEFQYLSGDVATVCYEVKLECKEKNDAVSLNSIYGDSAQKIALYISCEKIKTNIYDDNSIGRLHTIVDTETKLFCADSLEEYYYDSNDSGVKEELAYLKRKTYEDSQSFVFCNALSETLNVYNTENNHSKYYEILAELSLYFEKFLYIIGTRTSGLVQLKAGIPVYLPGYYRPLILSEKSIVALDLYKSVESVFVQINAVLTTLIPNLQLRLRGIPTTMENGEDGMFVRVMSERGNKTFPFEYESDGIIKIVSILADYIFVFNQGSATLVVDEFDSGVFEYLLGELLQIFESSGKGQFIFTSHNLRPLEVIDKKFIRFTTTDPENRYYRLKNVGASNNLRDLYLREVQLGNQDVEIYKRTKSFKIAKALKQAGEELVPNGEE